MTGRPGQLTREQQLNIGRMVASMRLADIAWKVIENTFARSRRQLMRCAAMAVLPADAGVTDAGDQAAAQPPTTGQAPQDAQNSWQDAHHDCCEQRASA